MPVKAHPDIFNDQTPLARALFDSAHQYVCLLTLEGRLIEANARIREFATAEVPQHQPPLVWRMSWWADHRHARDTFQRAIPYVITGTTAFFNAAWLGNKGQTVCLDFSLRAIRDAGGNAIELLLEGQDISAQLRAENAVADQSALLEAFFQSSPSGMVILDKDLRYLHINDTLAAISGLPAQAHTGKTIPEVAPHVAARVEPVLREILATGKPRLNYPVTCPTDAEAGGIRHWITSHFPIRNRAGEIQGIGGIITDVTERVIAEKQIHQLADEVIDLYQNAPCGYHSLDAEGRIVRINDTELQWLGYARHELIGRKLTDLLTPSSKAQFVVNFPRLLNNESIRDLEQEMIRKDGSILLLLLNSSAIFDDDGRFVMSRATTVDITERNLMAAEGKRQEERLTEISRHLIDIQEDERRRLAQEVHDVVSPNISAVQINLGIIEVGLSQAALKQVGTHLRDIRQLIQDTNTRLREICANLRPSLLDYAGLYAAVDTYQRQFSERTGLHIELTGGEAGGRLPANIEILLFRIVQEALVNCAKHAQARYVSIELSHDNEHAYLEINDDGIGFDTAELSSNGHKPGLGLLTMAERAEFAGGRFNLTSSPGHGTRITVEI